MPLTDRLPPGSADADLLVERPVGERLDEQGLSLYPAQEEALLEIVTGANVILSTPTGSGKSLVAVAAHAAALQRGHRAFYTAPIKALVSEKFFALIDVFGADKVGMLTGDAAVNRNLPIRSAMACFSSRPVTLTLISACARSTAEACVKCTTYTGASWVASSSAIVSCIGVST